MTLDRDRPEIPTPPEQPQTWCTQQSLTVPPHVNAKTRQKHDYPSAAWRRSHARRSAAERGFATAKDPASNDITRGWCRLTGLAPLMLFTVTLLVVRNQRILTAWNTRQEENQQRAARGPAPEDPQTPPQDPRRPCRNPPGHAHESRTVTTRTKTAAACPQPARNIRKAISQTPSVHEARPSGMSDPNVKLGPHET